VDGLLVPASTPRIGAALGALLLAAFSAAIGMALSKAKRLNCNSFGRLTRSPVSARTIARDIILCGASLLIVVAGPGSSLTSVVTMRAIAIAGAALVAVLVLLALVPIIQSEPPSPGTRHTDRKLDSRRSRRRPQTSWTSRRHGGSSVRIARPRW
jgi:hypothetical protein